MPQGGEGRIVAINLSEQTFSVESNVEPSGHKVFSWDDDLELIQGSVTRVLATAKKYVEIIEHGEGAAKMDSIKWAEARQKAQDLFA